MSQETITTLNTNTLIGYTDKRGTAWHYRAEEQGAESNHYTGAIPIDDVERRLFDWEAVEGQINATAMTEDGVLVAPNSDDYKPIMRSDTGRIMGIFKQGYKRHPYKDTLLRQVERIVDGDLAISSAGLLANGARAWVQVEMADTMECHGFEHRPFFGSASSFDGSLATTYFTGDQAVICDNTLSVGLATAATKFKVRHSTNSLGKLQDAREALQIVHSIGEAFEAQMEELLAIKVTDRDFDKFLAAHLELTDAKVAAGGRGLTIARNKQGMFLDLWKRDERVAPWAGTAFGVVQAVNTFDHHLAGVRGSTRVERNMGAAITGQFDRLDTATLATLRTVLA
jgi:phage/plasmid-like protein (TIGR03299 family)